MAHSLSDTATPMNVPGNGIVENDSSRTTLRSALGRQVTWVVALEIVLALVFGVLSPGHAFWSPANFTNVTLASAQVLLLCVTQAILLGAGQLDLAQGAVLIVASVLGGQTMTALLGTDGSGNLSLAITLGVCVSLVTGAVLGAVSGILVGFVGLNPLVATLGMLSIATGTAQVLTDGTNLTGLPGQLQSGFGIATLGSIPYPIIVSVVLVALIWITFATTVFGTHTLAVGSNKKAALRVGINAPRHIVTLYAVSGLSAGIAAILDISRFATTNISGHTNDALAAIAGAVIGGTSLFGGRISFPGAVFGALLAVILSTGLVVLNMPTFYQTIVVGVVLIGAVTIDRVRSRRSPERT